MKKAIILVMSCNQERYINEELIIKKTWGKDIIDGKYENLKLFFYRGGSKENYIDEENNVINLSCGDKLDETYEKCVVCFKFIEDIINEYDYVIRPNTSTYVNIDAIQQFLSIDNLKDDIILGSGLLINYISKYIPYLKGHMLIIPKKIVNIIANNKSDWHGYDDAVFGIVLGNYYGKKYMEHVLSFDSILDIKKPYFDKLSTSYCIRIKDEENFENNIVNMIGFHLLYRQCKIKTEIKPPHGFEHVCTIYGDVPI